MMRKIYVMLALLSLAVVSSAFAHKGEVHTYMGTVSAVHEDGSFMLTTTRGMTEHVVVSGSTTYSHSDGHVAKRSEIRAGSRVVAKIGKDGKTALSVKMAAPKQK